ncbi:hypothetical protein FRB94_004114 [Tulasnella sp. JGI-2019a]|nr:hypothetical protein FRB93_005484 [Tulasnella sp. JGI-2019a]KAG9002136.1 hypothetical protein FRB94_004114 [Tulasnella sp. JGI-2019a]
MVSRAAVLSSSYLAVSTVVAAPVFDKAKDVSGVDSHAHHHHHHHGVHNKHHRSHPKGLGLQKREDMMSTSANQTSTVQAPAPAIGDDSDDDEDDFILRQNNSTTVNSTMAIPQPNSTDDSTSLIDPGLRRRDFQRSKVDDQGWKQHRGQGDDSDSNHGDGHKHRHWEPRKGRTGHHGSPQHQSNPSQYRPSESAMKKGDLNRQGMNQHRLDHSYDNDSDHGHKPYRLRKYKNSRASHRGPPAHDGMATDRLNHRHISALQKRAPPTGANTSSNNEANGSGSDDDNGSDSGDSDSGSSDSGNSDSDGDSDSGNSDSNGDSDSGNGDSADSDSDGSSDLQKRGMSRADGHKHPHLKNHRKGRGTYRNAGGIGPWPPSRGGHNHRFGSEMEKRALPTTLKTKWAAATADSDDEVSSNSEPSDTNSGTSGSESKSDEDSDSDSEDDTDNLQKRGMSNNGGHKPHHHRKHKKGRIVDRHPNPMGPDLEGSGGDHDRRFRGLQKRGLDGRGSDRIGGGNDGHKHHNRKGWPGHHGHGAFHKRSPYANLERLD